MAIEIGSSAPPAKPAPACNKARRDTPDPIFDGLLVALTQVAKARSGDVDALAALGRARDALCAWKRYAGDVDPR